MHPFRALGRALTLSCALLVLGAGTSYAQTQFTVSLDTSLLVGHPGAPFSLDFQLVDGSGTDDGNNTVTLDNFVFGGGAATGLPTTSGGALGSLGSGITLTDTSFFNELFQSFTPGATLSFQVTLTGNADAGGTPDQFSFALLDSALVEVPTTGPGAFLTVDIDPPGVSIQTFGGAADYSGIGAPTILAAAPEPGALPLLGAGLGVGALLVRRRRR